MPKTKVRYLDVNVKQGGFVSRLTGGSSSKAHNFSDVKLLRNLLSNEKARILSVIKEKEPSSIYELTKILNRDFKSVREDIKTLERFGFVEFISTKKGKRRSLKPILAAEKLQIVVNI